MKSIGILGVGQAGGNIADIASTMGFQTALINTNQRDGLVNTGVEKKYFVPGYSGAGQDRAIGIQAVNDNSQDIIDFVKQSFRNIKLLLVAFSTDGGTGSGMSPLLIKLLLDQLPGINIGAITIVPEQNVLAGNRINATECIEELSTIEKISSVFLVDNDQMRKMNPQSSKQQIYLSANYHVMEAINHVLEVTKNSSLYGNFDETDLMRILNTRGVTIISSASVTDAKTTLDTCSKIHQSLENSVFCPMESESAIRAGLIYEGSENMSKLINVPSIFEKIGEPLQLFEGTYISDSDPTVTIILSGLSFPINRLLSLEQPLEENKDRLQNLINQEHTQKYRSRVSWAYNLKSKKQV